MSYQFCVVTKVGNDAYADEAARQPIADAKSERYVPGRYIHVISPVFLPGEILVVDRNKEVSGRDRDISDWSIEYTLFDTNQVDEAVALAKASSPELTLFDQHIMGLKEKCKHPSSEVVKGGQLCCTKCGMKLAI